MNVETKLWLIYNWKWILAIHLIIWYFIIVYFLFRKTKQNGGKK